MRFEITDCVKSEAYIPMSTIVLFVRLTITSCYKATLTCYNLDLFSLRGLQLLIVLKVRRIVSAGTLLKVIERIDVLVIVLNMGLISLYPLLLKSILVINTIHLG